MYCALKHLTPSFNYAVSCSLEQISWYEAESYKPFHAVSYEIIGRYGARQKTSA